MLRVLRNVINFFLIATQRVKDMEEEMKKQLKEEQLKEGGD